MQNYDRFDERCPCTSMIDCKLAGFRASTFHLSLPSPSFPCAIAHILTWCDG